MNDRYLFRGKRADNGEWVQGRLLSDDVIVPCGEEFELCDGYVECKNVKGFEVIPETVGQCTGLQDKNGKPIFEGDIVDVMYDPHYIGIAAQRIGVFKVMFHEGCFMKRNKKGYFHFIPSDECKIVGNVFDNADLAEELE